MEVLKGMKYSPGTISRYETALQHTIDFLHWKYKISVAGNRHIACITCFYSEAVENRQNSFFQSGKPQAHFIKRHTGLSGKVPANRNKQLAFLSKQAKN